MEPTNAKRSAVSGKGQKHRMNAQSTGFSASPLRLSDRLPGDPGEAFGTSLSRVFPAPIT